MSRRAARGVILTIVLAGACSAPPTKEINQAQNEIETARAAGAEQYAPESFRAATAALERTHEAVRQRDYRQALAHALDARERGRDAQRESAQRKAQLRSEAEQAIQAVVLALDAARGRLKSADASRLTSRQLASIKSGLAAADKALQEARAALERHEHERAKAASDTALTRIREAMGALNNALASRPGRRRTDR